MLSNDQYIARTHLIFWYNFETTYIIRLYSLFFKETVTYSMTYASILLRNEDLRLQIKVELTTYLLKVPNFQELRRSSSRIRETFLKCTYKVTANETHTLNQMHFVSKDQDNIRRGRGQCNAS